jgi:hypothetical protein
MNEVRELDVREPNGAAIRTGSVPGLIKPRVGAAGVEPAHDSIAV